MTKPITALIILTVACGSDAPLTLDCESFRWINDCDGEFVTADDCACANITWSDGYKELYNMCGQTNTCAALDDCFSEARIDYSYVDEARLQEMETACYTFNGRCSANEWCEGASLWAQIYSNEYVDARIWCYSNVECDQISNCLLGITSNLCR